MQKSIVFGSFADAIQHYSILPPAHGDVIGEPHNHYHSEDVGKRLLADGGLEYWMMAAADKTRANHRPRPTLELV